jgi:hypothetical protein
MSGAEHNDSARLETAFSTEEMDRTPGSCPSDDELWASASGELNPAANEAVILHLARCSECSSIWRLAREMLPADHLSQPSVVSIENRRRSQRWLRVLLPAAAAAILIGVGLSTGLFLRNDPASPPVYRQQDSDATILASPETRTLPRDSCRLRWSAGPDGTRYDVIVTDGELEILATVKGLGQPEYALPEEKIPNFTRELFWRVTAHLPDGRKLSSETFTTRIDDRASESDP